MNVEESSSLAKSIKEMAKTRAEMQADATNSVKSTAASAGSVNKLYKSGNKSLLVKAGLALIVFPEPIVSDVLGTALIAAGAVQQGIKRQSVYLEDLPKAFKSVMRDLKSAREFV